MTSLQALEDMEGSLPGLPSLAPNAPRLPPSEGPSARGTLDFPYKMAAFLSLGFPGGEVRPGARWPVPGDIWQGAKLGRRWSLPAIPVCSQVEGWGREDPCRRNDGALGGPSLPTLGMVDGHNKGIQGPRSFPRRDRLHLYSVSFWAIFMYRREL